MVYVWITLLDERASNIERPFKCLAYDTKLSVRGMDNKQSESEETGSVLQRPTIWHPKTKTIVWNTFHKVR